MQENPDSASARLTDLADKLDCLTELDFLLLTNIKPDTAESWRKRGDGPAYILAGNRFFYPRAAVSDWLLTRVRERRARVDPKGLL